MADMTVAAAAPRQRSFNDVLVVSFGHSLTHWYPSTFYLLLPLIGHELGLSYSEIGSILTCQYAAGAIANIPGGIMVDSVGRKGLLMAISLFWVGFPYLVMGFTHAYWMMLACATLVGIGNNIWHPTAIPWLANRFPERKGLVMSVHGMGGNVGDAIAPLVIGLLLQVYSWRTVVLMNVVPGIIMAVLILIYVGRLHGTEPPAARKAPRMTGAARLRGLTELLCNRALVTLSIGSFFRSVTQAGLLTFLPLYLAREMGYETKWIGACMFALQAAGFTAAPIAGHLSDSVGRRQVIMSSLAMTGVIIVAMAFAGGTGWFVLLVALLGFFLYAVRAVLQAWLLDATPPGMGGSAIGLLFSVQAAGAALGPISAGIVADHYGIMASFYFLAATIIVANVMVFFTPAGLMKKP
ncbi:MAG TPA: MFS transporter [Xanthobacteraceae bacterium]|nr:MFS transporter [Xanthobacteraceae bacterium]